LSAGSIIVLNGASSSGKTAVARAVCRMSERPWLQLGLDAFVDGLDRRWLADAVRVGADGRLIVGPVARWIATALRGAVVAAAGTGINVIADDIFLDRTWYDGWRHDLGGLDAVLVGVVAPLEVLEERERARGDRVVGAARAQLDLVHAWGGYDVTVDTSTADAAACATAILAALTSVPGSRAE
jgi:chloramphenicol 3-O phosphotransferase